MRPAALSTSTDPPVEASTGFYQSEPVPVAFPPDLPAHYRAQIGHFRNVITPEEHDFLVDLCRRKLKRAPFLNAHFDKVISGYREQSVSHWRVGVGQVAEENDRCARSILDRCRAILAEAVGHQDRDDRVGGIQWLPEHILELNADGTIGAHVDHLTASGSIVAALSLVSPTPIVFQHTRRPDWTIELTAEPCSLYFQCDDLRYDFTHAVPKPSGQGRISVMFRDKHLGPTKTEGTSGGMADSASMASSPC
ncbi:Alpha-ketoglutarate-dependent dioxygenase alkB 7, mitochondrial [Allomyces arbusculus]|nr:Alpha-ketoglutarate-dependent dioxygenase alkB 7, mitochondrial [Allomyces arbusculus]